MDCLTALNNTLALRYRGDHALSAEMLQCSAFWRVNDVGNYGACARLAAQARFCVVELLQAGALVTGTQGLCLPSECTADDLQPVTTTLDRLLPGALSTQGKGVLPGAKFSTTLTCGDHATPLSAAGVAVIAVAGASLLLVIAAGLVQCGANPHPNPHPDLNPNPSTNPSPNPDPDPDQVRCMGHNGADPKPNPHPNLEPNPNPNPDPNPTPETLTELEPVPLRALQVACAAKLGHGGTAAQAITLLLGSNVPGARIDVSSAPEIEDRDDLSPSPPPWP